MCYSYEASEAQMKMDNEFDNTIIIQTNKQLNNIWNHGLQRLFKPSL